MNGLSGTDTSTIHVLRPLETTRWDELVSQHPRSSIFHTTAWLQALRQTYGYEPIVITTSPSGSPLEGGMVFCSIYSWITGRRWVSLPFSDHCGPLVTSTDQYHELLHGLEPFLAAERLRYLEVRPLEPLAIDRSPSGKHWQPCSAYCLHQLDLSPGIGTLFNNCHKDCTQRKIRRAERENLEYQEGRSETLIHAFYRLMVLTRRRQGLPPQPKKWFKNLAALFGNALKIRVASKRQRPVAAMITIRHKDTLVYKYGCSDSAHNNLGGTHLLFWRCIEEGKQEGIRLFDFGRSGLGDQGLIQFKDRWGCTRSPLVYSILRVSDGAKRSASAVGRDSMNQITGKIISHLPDNALTFIGTLAYKHIG
jgi:CelD/BcsL family acetyltransferase involved in cellulose biosynthesis